jgi:FixJ family two-component response regulator
MTDQIYIVDDDGPFRASIGRLLELHGYGVVQFGSADAVLEDLGDGGGPSCILLDVRLPGLSGPALQERLAELGCASPIIFLTGFGDVPTTVKAIKAGADDVLTKPVSAKVLIESITSALDRFQRERPKREWHRAARARLESLTPREREVFDRVVQGKANKQTARELGITERTVKAHRQRIFEKLHAKTVAELVSLAERLEILDFAEPTTKSDAIEVADSNL